MITAFSLYIRNIAIFLIFTAFANIMIPTTKYKPYINLALGFVMIFLLLTPLRVLITSAGGEDIETILDGFTNRFQTTAAPSTGDISEFEGMQTDLILSTYVESIQSQIETLIAEDDTFIYQDSSITVDDTEERFGEIKEIAITLREKTAEERAADAQPTAQPLIRIEPVAIDTTDIFSTRYKPDSAEAEESEEIKSIKKLFSDFYNLSHDNIYINVTNTEEKQR